MHVTQHHFLLTHDESSLAIQPQNHRLDEWFTEKHHQLDPPSERAHDALITSLLPQNGIFINK